MVTIRVEAGTDGSSESLCRTCTRGHIITGYRETEHEVFCRHFYIEREIRFPVKECTFYEDKRIANLTAMEEIAWFLTTRKPGRTVGFVSAAQFREEQEAEAGHAAKESVESQQRAAAP